MLSRALTTPPISPTDFVSPEPVFKTNELDHQAALLLTPPTSPRLMRTSSDFSRILQPTTNTSNTPSQRRSSHAKDFNGNSDEDTLASGEVIECAFDVEVLKDQRGRDQVFGTGAWSIVYKAIGRAKYGVVDQTSNPSFRRNSIPVFVAVKTPSRRDAIPILKSEAMIMSELTRTFECDENVVPFYGIIPSTNSIVMAAVPLSLEDHIKSCARKESGARSTWDTPGPVVGSTAVWLDLAKRSISALAWLHEDAIVVHGDIKPGNILLRLSRQGEDKFGYDPLLTDFSSGQLLEAEAVTPNTLSAITREYAAPELLTSAVLKNPESAATTASDIFSLAVTLLVCATGELMVYSGGVWQRQAMATQGWNIMNNVRNGEQGDRIPRHGVVEQVLEKAVLRADMGRIDAQAWKTLVEEKARGEPAKMMPV
jgi:Protein kinase domain